MGRTRQEQTVCWRDVVLRLERSGLSVAAFSRRQKISPASLDYWQRRLATPGTSGRGNGHGDGHTAKKSRDQPLRFMPLTLGRAPSRFEVRLASGTSIPLPERFDPQTLVLVLQAVLAGERADT